MGITTSNPKLLVVGGDNSGKAALKELISSPEWEIVTMGCKGFAEMDAVRPKIRNEIESGTLKGIIITIDSVERDLNAVLLGKSMLAEVSSQTIVPPVLIALTKSDGVEEQAFKYLKFSLDPSPHSSYVELESITITDRLHNSLMNEVVCTYNPAGSHRDLVSGLFEKSSQLPGEGVAWKDSNPHPVVVFEFNKPLREVHQYEVTGTDGDYFPTRIKVEGSLTGRDWVLTSEISHTATDTGSRPFLVGSFETPLTVDALMETYKLGTLLKTKHWVLQSCSATTHRGIHQIKSWMESLIA
eukprot:TRINITY_DN29017_c0_g1_i1.p1 TRINITY_DN29017_c0_g1~~TRINITY_DN29017_c0_g1_i1.p1  ORF type:complete len:299 (+),score=46.83 TRINITY_DN29017_c0_g1_i1:105-1001(+)